MKKEQEEIVQIFRNTYNPTRKGPMVIYGTGVNAEAVITCCKDYPIVGVLDVAKIGEAFCGFLVMSLEEVLKKNIKEIVVVARPSVHGIIYKRIQKFCEDNGIVVLDIYGNNVARKVKVREYDIPYFKVSYDDLKREINNHEIISFDVFDTLLLRKVYEPTDVFDLIDCELSGQFSFVFSNARKIAEHELRKMGEPTIYQIYEYLAKKYHLSQNDMQYLLSLELEKERQVLCARQKMKFCMKYCIEQGKKVYLLSDMYLPAEILGELLNGCGITGYTELLVSCDYSTSKSDKLFDILKNKAGRGRYLHIGDNIEADYESPKKHSIDAFLIMSAVRMMELSVYSDAFVYLKSIESRVMIGMLAAEMFEDPFALNGTKGLPVVADAERFGYVFIAPLALSFTVWLLHKVNMKKHSLLLFSARDGWVIQKIFQQLADAWHLNERPEDIYFMVSRKALEIVENGKDEVAKKNYLAYLRTLNFENFDQIYFFDFMSRGTCQSLLEKISGQKMQGVYFQKSISGIAAKDAIQVYSFFKEKSAHDKDLRIFALCDFLECIFTSYQPSFNKITGDGTCIYEVEKRSNEQIQILKEIHSGIFKYCNEFAEAVSKLPEDMPDNAYCDEILKFTASGYSQIKIPELKNFILDDCFGGDKNTGIDALM